MFIESRTWGGYPAAEMAEVYRRVVPTGYRSPVAPPKPPRKKADPNRKRGVVKRYNISNGFGFITLIDGSDVFFHIADAKNSGTDFFMRGDHVTLEVTEDKRGRTRAVNVRLV